MTVLHLARRDLAGLADDRAIRRPHIRPFVPGVDECHVLAVAREFPPRGWTGPAVRAAGLVMELESRAGRMVAGWLAWPRNDADCRGLIGGLVTLVQARSSDGDTRWSIGWLLVRPQMRRQGLGRELVATALGAAATAGASAVWVETDNHWSGSLAFWHAVGFQSV